MFGKGNDTRVSETQGSIFAYLKMLYYSAQLDYFQYSDNYSVTDRNGGVVFVCTERFPA